MRVNKRPRGENEVADADPFAVSGAKTIFYSQIFGMGWRLALTVLVPIFAGIWADKRLGTYPSITLAAYFFAIFASGVLIYRTYSQLNADAADTRGDKKPEDTGESHKGR